MSARAAYLELTLAHRAAGLFTREGFSSHLSMALGALLGLGASADVLHAFAARYASRLPPPACLPAAKIAQRHDVHASLSGPATRPLLYADLLTFFSDEIERHGAAAVQSEWLDELLQAPASTAFHSLIRLAYGSRFGHPAEIASGLADLVANRRVLPRSTGTALPMADALARLTGCAALFDSAWQQPPISQRLGEVVASGAFSVACAPLKVARGEAVAALDVLCDASITEYLDGISFTALHLITSRHALRLLLPTLTDAAAALRAFWPAWAAALVVARSTAGQRAASDAPGGEPAAAWHALVARTLPSDDDHVIKMVFTCKEEHERTGDARYLRAAACLLDVGHS